MDRMPDRWRVPPGSTVHLDRIDPGATPGAPGGKEETLAALPSLLSEMDALQDRLSAEARRSVLIVLQGLDASGKDGTIRHVFKGVNPQGVNVSTFKVPVGEELRHDFLWRVHPHCPGAGEIGIFNRSHYEDVLAARVRKLVPPEVWRERFDLINSFERLLSHGGTTILKFYLHISRDEQRSRLKERLRDPDKRWKFRAGDLVDRAHWGGYQRAYEEAINQTSTHHGPWFIIPADNKWYRDWAVSEVLVATLRQLDPRYPQPLEALPEDIE
jgi:PPK2 family polyphosphate:nucleotide phosphotransferase